ncbi:hypothetical protein D3C87_1782840 [compost metagenome]
MLTLMTPPCSLMAVPPASAPSPINWCAVPSATVAASASRLMVPVLTVVPPESASMPKPEFLTLIVPVLVALAFSP